MSVGQNNNALITSEMFVEYAASMKRAELQQLERVKIAITEEQKKLEEANRKKFEKDTSDINKGIDEQFNASDVPEPFVRNLDYGEYQEHVKDVQEARESEDSVYEKMIGDYKIEQHTASDDYDLLKEAMDELIESGQLYGLEPEYSTEIGVVTPVEPLDYYLHDVKDTECPQDQSDDSYKSGNEVEMVEPVVTEEEIVEAEKVLGLDMNIFYILQKMAKGLNAKK